MKQNKAGQKVNTYYIILSKIRGALVIDMLHRFWGGKNLVASTNCVHQSSVSVKKKKKTKKYLKSEWFLIRQIFHALETCEQLINHTDFWVS